MDRYGVHLKGRLMFYASTATHYAAHYVKKNWKSYIMYIIWTPFSSRSSTLTLVYTGADAVTPSLTAIIITLLQCHTYNVSKKSRYLFFKHSGQTSFSSDNF